MSGATSLVLDTNAVIALLAGNEELRYLSEQANELAISIVTYVEFLSSPRLTADDAVMLEQFLSQVEVIDIAMANAAVIEKIIDIRRSKALKLSDAIVVAAALHRHSSLVTADGAIHRSGLVPCLHY